MTNIFKMKKYFVVTLVMILFSFPSFAQSYSDEAIGFDLSQMTVLLKERGVSDKDLNSQIKLMREDFVKMYKVQKQIEDNILQEIKSKNDSKIKTKKISSLRTTNTLNVVTEDIPQSEKDALLAIFNSMDGINWTNKSGWDFNTPVTSWNYSDNTGWYGITVKDGHVVGINLIQNKLKGQIPQEIGQLSNLKYLLLTSNTGISGTIPTEIGNLINLEYFSLNGPLLTGTIPATIVNLKKLHSLLLFGTNLTGNFVDICQLTELKSLWLQGNPLLFGGTIPNEIGNLTKLNQLLLANCNLTGEIPPSLYNLTQLKDLDLQGNNLEGSISSNIGNMKELSQLMLSMNKFTGKLPDIISTLSQLSFITLDLNNFSQTIPDLSNLSALTGLRISYNNFYFADFVNQFSNYKNKLSIFEYFPLWDTDTAKTINAGIGTNLTLTMFEDGRTASTDTFQWYKNNVLIPGATSRTYTISNLQASHAGNYTCIAKNSIITDLILTRNIIRLQTTACTPLTGSINSIQEKFCISDPSTFSLQLSGTNLKYKWSAVTTENVELDSKSDDTTGNYSYTFTNPGSYTIKAEVTDEKGCITTFTKSITVVDCQPLCINRPINFSFDTTSSNLSYEWYTTKEGSTQQLNPITNTTGQYSFTPTSSGIYTVYLKASKNSECVFEFTKVITVEKCEDFISCTKNNLNTPKIKTIFKTLVNKLLTLPAETITDGYTCDELKALEFYIKDKKPAIFNFVRDTQQGFVAFSFTDHPEYDVKIALNGNTVADFNLDDYENNETITKLTTTPSSNIISYVNHIDFCSELYCISHVAIVVDESSSISLPQMEKIKKQLRKYIQQQANDNDRLQSNIYVSLIGMSDSDIDNRPDHVQPTRVSNEIPSSLTDFNRWIEGYGNRGKVKGVSASSDFWKSGLDYALNLPMKPNIVLMITDGCETTNVEALRDDTMSKFSNSKSTLNPGTDKPHLYVLGIENGFYVDGGITNTAVSRSQDPNYVQGLTASASDSRVVPLLRTSLKYLLSLDETEYPRSKIDDFSYDYYGFETFDSLASSENEAYLSDNLKLSKFTCGDPTDKNYCSDCLTFQPSPEKEYMLSAWVKEESAIQVKTYENAAINLIYYNNVNTTDDRYIMKIDTLYAKGDIIDGWQRINYKFVIPKETRTIGIELENKSGGIPVYFDDLRIHPVDGSVKTFVYDPETFKLMSELDENNYSTFYEYDNEGGLVRVKKETAKGIKTIQETRSGNYINN